MLYGSARTVGSKTHLRLPWMKKIHGPKLPVRHNRSPAFIGEAWVRSRSPVSFFVCDLILDVVGLIESLSREMELERLLFKGERMRGSRWALIILGIFLVSTLGCLPTPSVSGEIRPAGEGHGRARMVYISLSGLYLQDKGFTRFSGQNGFRFDLSPTT